MSVPDRWPISMFAAALGIFLVACNATPPMDVSRSESAVSTARHSDRLESAKIEIPVSEQASFALSRVVSGIKRGTPIANFPTNGVEGTEGALCNLSQTPMAPLMWKGSSSQELGNWSTELGEIFFEVLNGQGFNITGDPQDLFGRAKSVQGAEYLIAGRIVGIAGNICRVHQFWEFRNLGIYSGEMSVKVCWTRKSSD